MVTFTDCIAPLWATEDPGLVAAIETQRKRLAALFDDAVELRSRPSHLVDGVAALVGCELPVQTVFAIGELIYGVGTTGEVFDEQVVDLDDLYQPGPPISRAPIHLTGDK